MSLGFFHFPAGEPERTTQLKKKSPLYVPGAHSASGLSNLLWVVASKGQGREGPLLLGMVAILGLST